MSWNHRVIKHSQLMSDGVEETWFSIHEVYYNEDGSLQSYTESPVEPVGESLLELSEDLARFQKALAKPVLNPMDFKEANSSEDDGARIPYVPLSIPPSNQFAIMDEIEERALEIKRQEADAIELAAWDALCLATIHAPNDFVGPLTYPSASVPGFAIQQAPIEIEPIKTIISPAYKSFPVPRDRHEEISQQETGIAHPCPFCQGRVLPRAEWSTGTWCCEALWRIRCDQAGEP